MANPIPQNLMLAAAVLGVFPAAQVTAQAPPAVAAPRALEVASIRPALFPNDDYFRGWTAASGICGAGARRPAISGNGLTLPKVSLCQLIALAYEVQEFRRISNAPAWMMKLERSNFYDVAVKAEGSRSVD